MIEIIRYKFRCGVEAVVSFHEKATSLKPMAVDYWVGDERLLEEIETAIPPEQLIKIVMSRRPKAWEKKQVADEFKKHLQPMLVQAMAHRMKLDTVGVIEL